MCSTFTIKTPEHHFEPFIVSTGTLNKQMVAGKGSQSINVFRVRSHRSSHDTRENKKILTCLDNAASIRTELPEM